VAVAGGASAVVVGVLAIAWVGAAVAVGCGVGVARRQLAKNVAATARLTHPTGRREAQPLVGI
jgi:hypothetical protein